MLYLVDQSLEYAKLIRAALYRHLVFCEVLERESLPNHLTEENRDFVVLPRPSTYSAEEVKSMQALCVAQNIPFLVLEVQSEKTLVSGLLSAIEELERQEKCRYIALRHGGVSDTLTDATSCVFGLPVPLTPTERMILRYMLYVFPKGASKEEIAHFCLSPEKGLTLSNIPTHIRKINSAFSPCYGCRIITHKAGAYRLMEDLPRFI